MTATTKAEVQRAVQASGVGHGLGFRSKKIIVRLQLHEHFKLCATKLASRTCFSPPPGSFRLTQNFCFYVFARNVPGAAMYFTVLNESRTLLARRKINGQERTDTQSGTSALPKLSNTENLVAGGASRAAIGFVMMPATVIKVRYEVRRRSGLWRVLRSQAWI